MLLIGMLLLISGISQKATFAQQGDLQRSHPISISNTLEANVPDTLTIIAVRVSFQPDDNRLTSGDGTFGNQSLPYLEDSDIAIDPLPHDQSYFENHLTFAKNYFEQVSGGQIHLKYRVLPDIYELPEKMESYSPTGEQFTNEKVAQLTQDTWQQVEARGGFATTNLDPQKTAFAIFHAGIGRDIQLTGTTLDKTPQDIPSLYLDQQSLSSLLDQPNFNGFSINDGNFRVTNSMILPRSLSRRGENISGEQYVLQLSINGLICASIGSYLGLPDLFNTRTGDSGIGRFGLMDGESFFSYRGLFPPEPSAWEKTFLGWQNPVMISKSRASIISLPSASSHQENSIAKIPLSADEYFLVENRHRDPNNNGVTVTFERPDGTTETKHYSNYDEDFVNQSDAFEESLIPGVVTDVSNPDWSLPGGLDIGPDTTRGTDDDRLLNGGILIWHIDEAVINQNISAQSVNNDPQRRGVDLEEADGAQDIGRAANDDFSQQARGTAFDFWWSGNDGSVVTLDNDTLSFYENRFGPDTRPSNHSNTGAPAFFELFDFSDNQPVASFQIRRKSSNNITAVDLPIATLEDQQTYTEVDDYFSAYPLGLTFVEAQPDSFLVIPSRQSAHALHLNNDQNPLFEFNTAPVQQPYVGENLILGEIPDQSMIDITAWKWSGSQWNIEWDNQIESNSAFLSSNDDQILHADFTAQQIDLSSGNLQNPLPRAQQRSENTANGAFTTLTEDQLTLQPAGNTYSVSSNDKRHYTGALQLTENESAFFYLSDNSLLLFRPEQFDSPQTIIRNTPVGWPAFVDLNNDEQLDFIYINKKNGTLEARNVNGALLPHFPIEPPSGNQFVGTPIVTASNQSDQQTLYVATQDSVSLNINAYTTNGSPVEGYPLYVGAISDPENIPIHPIIHNQTLYAVSHNGDIKAWQLPNNQEVLWGSQYGNTFSNKVSGSVQTDAPENPGQSTNAVLVKDETYNWPNPADDFTNIRFETGSVGKVEIQIVTSSGRVIFDQQYESTGNGPQEHQISTQNWSSGVYFAMISATVNGETARKMLKIAVIK